MSKKGINSRAKGARGERMAAEFLKRFGFQARRAQQYSGQDGSQDLKHDVPGVHIEVKWVERLNIHDAMEQATRDCMGKTPVVLHKKNGSDWLATLPAEHLIRLLGGEDYSDL